MVEEQLKEQIQELRLERNQLLDRSREKDIQITNLKDQLRQNCCKLELTSQDLRQSLEECNKQKLLYENEQREVQKLQGASIKSKQIYNCQEDQIHKLNKQIQSQKLEIDQLENSYNQVNEDFIKLSKSNIELSDKFDELAAVNSHNNQEILESIEIFGLISKVCQEYLENLVNTQDKSSEELEILLKNLDKFDRVNEISQQIYEIMNFIFSHNQILCDKLYNFQQESKLHISRIISLEKENRSQEQQLLFQKSTEEDLINEINKLQPQNQKLSYQVDMISKEKLNWEQRYKKLTSEFEQVCEQNVIIRQQNHDLEQSNKSIVEALEAQENHEELATKIMNLQSDLQITDDFLNQLLDMIPYEQIRINSIEYLKIQKEVHLLEEQLGRNEETLNTLEYQFKTEINLKDEQKISQLRFKVEQHRILLRDQMNSLNHLIEKKEEIFQEIQIITEKEKRRYKQAIDTEKELIQAKEKLFEARNYQQTDDKKQIDNILIYQHNHQNQSQNDDSYLIDHSKVVLKYKHDITYESVSTPKHRNITQKITINNKHQNIRSNEDMKSDQNYELKNDNLSKYDNSSIQSLSFNKKQIVFSNNPDETSQIEKQIFEDSLNIKQSLKKARRKLIISDTDEQNQEIQNNNLTSTD